MSKQKQALIIDSVAVNVVSSDPAGFFHPDIAAEFAPVPDEVEVGWRHDPETGVWSPSPVDRQPEPPVAAQKVSPVEFKLLFTAQERVAIKAARATDPVIDDFYEVVEDSRLTHVDLGLASTRDAVAYLASKALITEARVSEILSGALQ